MLASTCHTHTFLEGATSTTEIFPFESRAVRGPIEFLQFETRSGITFALQIHFLEGELRATMLHSRLDAA